MTPLIASALVGDSWQPEWGRRVFDREGVDLAPLVAAHEAALVPCDVHWLTDRLELLWTSSPVAGNIDATAWLHETIRLIADIPQDILSVAIDEAVRKSERGFMPGVGEIRALADPQLARRKLHCWRLKQIDRLKPEPPLAAEERCTPEQAKEIRDRLGLKVEDEQPVRAFRGPPTSPTREEYIQWGVDPDDLPQVDRNPKGQDSEDWLGAQHESDGAEGMRRTQSV